MTLEQVFQQIAAKNDLSVISFSMSTDQSERHRFTVTAHWTGHSRAGNPCQFGYGSTVAEALKECLAAVSDDRDDTPTVDFSELLRMAA